jgi:drug/metabolite transporter (DMT)-like permease
MSPDNTPEKTQETTAAILQRAILMAVVAEGILTLMDAIVKMLSAHYPIFQISFMRFAVGSVLATAIFAANGPHWPSRDSIRFNALRSVIGVCASLTFFTGLSLLPLAEAMAISFAAPLMIAVMGVVFLGERLSPRIGLALVAGFLGMLVIVSGQIGTQAYSPGALRGAIAVLASTVFYALFLIMLRVRANRDSLPTLLLFQNAGPAIIMAIPAAFVWHPPNAQRHGALYPNRHARNCWSHLHDKSLLSGRSRTARAGPLSGAGLGHILRLVVFRRSAGHRDCDRRRPCSCRNSVGKTNLKASPWQDPCKNSIRASPGSHKAVQAPVNLDLFGAIVPNPDSR